LQNFLGAIVKVRFLLAHSMSFGCVTL